VNENIDKTKLAGILKSLDKKDRLAAKKFLASPYFNTNEDLGVLFIEINKLIDKNKSLSKLILWKKLIKNKAYSDVRFRKFCSDLSKLMEQFLSQKAFDKHPIQHKIFSLKSLNENKQKATKLATSTIKEANDMMKNYPYRDTSYYLNQYQLQKQFYDFYDYDTNRDEKSNLEEISKNLDYFYFGEKLKLIVNVMTRRKHKAYVYNLNLKDEILSLTENNSSSLSNSPQVKVYFQIQKIFSEPENEEHYFKFKKIIEENAFFFPREVAIEELYGAAQNYCVRKINAGNQKFLNELFDLFKMLIDQGLIISEDKISPWYFRNIVFTGLRLGKYKWVESFIHQHKNYLPKDLKENAVTYNLAQLYFYQKKYREVIGQLQFVEYDDLSYNLNSKAMLLATYYELDEIDLLDSHLDTFNSFLKRRKDFPPERSLPYRNLIKFTKKLSRLLPNDTKALEKMKEEIAEIGNVANANWLLEKIGELGG